MTNELDIVRKLVQFSNHSPTTVLIKNLDAKAQLFVAGSITFPLTISNPLNCYLCCPSTGNIDYALEETRHFTNRSVVQSLLAAATFKRNRAAKPTIAYYAV